MHDEADLAHMELLLALTRTYHRLTTISDRLHGPFGVSTGTRSILLLLHLRGGLTLSEIARDRAVSRQFIQRAAAPLIDGGLIALVANPQSKRSPKLRLTTAGESKVRDILGREAPLFRAITGNVSAVRAGLASEVLGEIDICLKAFPII